MNPESNPANPEISALQRQVFALLVALIVVSGTLTVFLYRQASLAGKDIDAIKPQAQQMIGVFNQNQALMVDFVNQLVAYGEKHPEFRPVLAKYGIAPIPGIPAGSPAGATPAAPAAPKK
jgi:hypothetical protein